MSARGRKKICVLMNKASGPLEPIFQRLEVGVLGGGAQPPLMALKIIRPLQLSTGRMKSASAREVKKIKKRDSAFSNYLHSNHSAIHVCIIHKIIQDNHVLVGHFLCDKQ